MATKPKKHAEYRELSYSSARWALFVKLREKAKLVMTALEDFRLHTLVHGSIARGDVNKSSDIDIFVAEPQSSFLLETALERSGVPVNARLLIQATPNYAMKAYIEVEIRRARLSPMGQVTLIDSDFSMRVEGTKPAGRVEVKHVE